MKWKGTTGMANAKGLHVYVKGKTTSIGQAFIVDFKHDIRGKRIPCLQGENNAQLFANAINTVQKCDLMPSELLEQRDELLEALRGSSRSLAKYNSDHAIDQYCKNYELIKKIEG